MGVKHKSKSILGVETAEVCKGPDDEKFLSAAVSGNAGYIVTKNKKHFPRNSPIEIVNVREFLSKLEKK